MRLAIVTLTKDNTAELELTLKSVWLQSKRPFLHLVVDSSRAEFAKRALEISERFDAKYVWVEPHGIYEAMEFSLTRLGVATHVMWLNSSDWLASKNALSLLIEPLNQPSRASWAVGELIRREESGLRFHRAGGSGSEFIRLMELGVTGFPHPSTVFEIEKVRQVGGYESGMQFRVANDYDLALRFGRQFGPPIRLRSVVSFHVPGGFSANHKVRGFLERVASRLLRLPLGSAILSLLFLPRNIPFSLFRDVGLIPRRTVQQQDLEELKIEHFCGEVTELAWPRCCDEFLGVTLT
jgi:hypothetical protein